jgi:Spy/CpxP family protein refolding chaperone
MIDNIQSGGSMYGNGLFASSQTLTSDQKSQIQSILSQYDPANLTASDAKSILHSLRKAGIRPGEGLKDELSTSGFDLGKLFSLAKPSESDQTEGTGISGGIDVTALQQLKSILDRYDLTDLSTDEQSQLVSQLNSSGLIDTGGNVQGGQSMQGPGTFPPSQPLTDDQESQIQSVLSKYDSSNLTSDDAKSILDSFRKAGIPPGKELEDAISSAGFDAKKLFSLAGPPPGAPPSGSRSGSTGTSTGGTDVASVLQQLQSILGQYDLNNLTSDQQSKLITQLSNTGLIIPALSQNIDVSA